MPLSLVSNVALGAETPNPRTAMRRRPPARQPSAHASSIADDPFANAPEFEDDDAPSSSTSLSILAQALAAYSQN
jgi:hypothetical protein